MCALKDCETGRLTESTVEPLCYECVCDGDCDTPSVCVDNQCVPCADGGSMAQTPTRRGSSFKRVTVTAV